jgi:hypothetical protein
MNVSSMENIIAKRQLNWMGKMARMDENRLPLKMLSCWMNESRPSRRPHTSTRNSMIRSLQILNPNISNDGDLKEWFHLAKDAPEWNSKLESLDPPKLTDETDDHCSTQEQPDELVASNIELETGENHILLSPTEYDAWSVDSRSALHTRRDSTNTHPQYSLATEPYWPSSDESENRSHHHLVEELTPLSHPDCLRETTGSESWRYTNRRPPPLVLPHQIEDRHNDPLSPMPLEHSLFRSPIFFSNDQNYYKKIIFDFLNSTQDSRPEFQNPNSFFSPHHSYRNS